jgi:hypothetical protein
MEINIIDDILRQNEDTLKNTLYGDDPNGVAVDNVNNEMDQLMKGFINNVNAIPEADDVVSEEVPRFDPRYNMLNDENYCAFLDEVVFEETNLFTMPINTTTTMEGFLSNVRFHEKDLLDELDVDAEIVTIRCNFGKLIFAGYTAPVKVRTTNRGRKKKERVKKLRKKQGEGTDFSSQMTFIIRATDELDANGRVPPNSVVYKFKAFRNGMIQLPGARPESIEEIIICAKKLEKIFNFHLHPFEQNLALRTSLTHLNPVMKNYKFTIKLANNHIIDQTLLYNILIQERRMQRDTPRIFMIKYSRQETKLSIKFLTPTPKKPKKTTRVNVFMRGKVNILGAYNAETTTAICKYLHGLFEVHKELFVYEGVVVPPPPLDVSKMTIEEWLQYKSITLPTISEDDFDRIMNGIDYDYDQMINDISDDLYTLMVD